jgi:Carboxypeptidase regulatory-like domain/TonB dependent receptor
MHNILRWIAGFAGMLAIITSQALAQGGNQGILEGVVTDASGAVLSSATITVTDSSKGAELKATSNDSGIFVFPVVPVGTYTVRVQHDGFAPVEANDVQISVGGKVNLPLHMQVAGGTETIRITEEAPVIDTTRTTVAETINELAVANLPTNGRNFLDFALLTPGVVRDVRGGDLSFGGQRGTLNSLTIDGTDNNNTFFGQTLGRTGSGRAPYQFSQDAVQEFQVNTSSYAPEFGRAGGAVINVVTKSGTNQFHGTAFEFFRDRGLNSNDQSYSMQRDFFNRNLRGTAPLKPGYHYNQFGGNLGGPVIKDKLFFFFDYDGQRNQAGVPVSLSLPTPTNAAQAAAVKYLQDRSQTYNTTFNQDVYLGKLDYSLNDRNQISLRYNAQRFNGQNLENSGTTSAQEHTGASNVISDTVGLQWNSTITSKLINTLRLSYQRDSEPGKANSINPEAAVRSNNALQLTVGRNNFSPRETTLHRQQYADTLSYVLSTHTLKFGFDILHDSILNLFPGNFSGAYTFDTLDNFGNSLLGLPLNLPTTPTSNLQLVQAYAGPGTTGPRTTPNLLQAAFFLQDDWRITPRLTVDYGLRWDRETFHQPSVQNATALQTDFNTANIPVDDMNFGPRVGFAWQPTADGKTVVRGGSGIFFGNTPSILVGTASSNNALNVQTLTFRPTKNNPYFPNYPNNTCGAPTTAPNCTIPATTGIQSASNIYVFSQQYHQPEIIQWNLQVQQQLAKDFSATLGYLGVRGLRIQRTRDANFVSEAPATIQSTDGKTFTYEKISSQLLNSGFNHIFQFESTAHSTYHGMTAQLDKRFGNGLQLNLAYTWSKVLDDAPDATAVVVGSDDGKLVYDPLRPRLDLGRGNDDIRNRFVFSEVWNFDPFVGNLTGISRRLLGGWTLSSILTAQSGLPFSPTLSADLNADGISRNERVPGVSRNLLTMPNFYSLDPRITKDVSIAEGVKFQLITEAFNILNHTNIVGLTTNQYLVTGTTLTPNSTGTTAFGVPTSFGSNASYNGRVIQLAGKIVF